MRRIPFDLDYWMLHHPMVETRDGSKARVLCTDCLTCCKPVVALVDESSDGFPYESVYCFGADGRYISSEEYHLDLMMLVYGYDED